MDKYVSLEEILFFREEKVRIQEELRKKYEGSTVVALGMNIPGPRKTSEGILLAFNAGIEALSQMLAQQGMEIMEEIVLKKKEGYLKIYAVKCRDFLSVKKIAVQLEETHPLGRLFDIDVYDGEGRGISREEFGLGVRKCLICETDAKLCGRNRSHSVEELYSRVEDMIETWRKMGSR